jgi:hypothetical protein
MLPPAFHQMNKGPKPSEAVRRPPIFYWYLAELYSELRELDVSLRYARQYFATLPDNRFFQQERAIVKSLIDKLKG